MIAYDDVEITPTMEQVTSFAKQVEQFRCEGPLDKVSLAKLQEHF